MSPQLHALAVERQALLARSSVARLQLHRDARGVRQALRPRQMLASAARTLTAKLVFAALGFVAARSNKARSVRYRTDSTVNKA
jgi:hypothetical protein